MAKRGKKKGYDVISVGSATVDCFVSIPYDIKDIKHGSKNLINGINLLTGGGGTNVAVGLARLGIRTGLIAEVGEDHSAHIIKNEMAKEGVDFLVKQHSRHQTAYSVILEAKGKDRAILAYKGASSYLHRDEIPNTLNTEWFYFGSLMGASFDTMKYLANMSYRKKIGVYFNPSSYMVKQGRKFLQKVIDATDILAMNREEAHMLLGLKKKTQTKELLKMLQDLGPGIVIVTDGKNGVQVFDGKTFYSGKPKKIKAVDTTGAGDAFGTGFLAGMIMKKNLSLDRRIRFAIKLGLADSASVVRHTGTKAGLLKKREALAKCR